MLWSEECSSGVSRQGALTVLQDVGDVDAEAGQDALVHPVVLTKPRHLQDETSGNLQTDGPRQTTSDQVRPRQTTSDHVRP